MKKILSLLAIVTMVGCDTRLSKDRMAHECRVAQLKCEIQLAKNNIDSAFYFKGKAAAFYEAAYNEDINQ